jgi:hypothetical protein
LRLLEAFDVIKRKAKSSGIDVLDDDFFEAWLVDRQLASPKPLHLARVNVDSDNLVAELCETCGCDQSNIVGADDCDMCHCSAV